MIGASTSSKFGSARRTSEAFERMNSAAGVGKAAGMSADVLSCDTVRIVVSGMMTAAGIAGLRQQMRPSYKQVTNGASCKRGRIGGRVERFQWAGCK